MYQKPDAIGVPRDAAARRSPIHPRHYIGERLSRRHIVHGHVAAFAAALRHRHSHPFAVERWHIEVDLDAALGVHLVGIDQHALRRGIVRRLQRHQHHLFLGRLRLQCEQRASAIVHREISRRLPPDQLLQLLRYGSTHRQAIEVSSRLFVLRVAPGLHRRVSGIFQPAIVVDHLDAVVSIRHGPLRSSRRLREEGARQQACARDQSDMHGCIVASSNSADHTPSKSTKYASTRTLGIAAERFAAARLSSW